MFFDFVYIIVQRYEATVVDADDLSLTVIYRDEDKKWKDANVDLLYLKLCICQLEGNPRSPSTL